MTEHDALGEHDGNGLEPLHGKITQPDDPFLDALVTVSSPLQLHHLGLRNAERLGHQGPQIAQKVRLLHGADVEQHHCAIAQQHRATPFPGPHHQWRGCQTLSILKRL
jgi:hypothetical protein